MPSAIELDTTLALAQGAYTVAMAFGSEGRHANLILDTGSSTLAILPKCYEPDRDQALRATAWAQEISYGGGAWAGPVLRSRLAFGHGHHARAIDDALFALIESEQPPFRGADGILGLAYRGLDPAYDMTSLLETQGVDPALTWSWPFEDLVTERMHRELDSIAANASDCGAEAADTLAIMLARIEELSGVVLGSMPSSPPAPRLTESWFCCAEPTAGQGTAVGLSIGRVPAQRPM